MLYKKNSVKIILLGDQNVGKTTIAYTFFYGEFDKQKCNMILDASYIASNIEFNNNKISVHLWDTAGQQRFRIIHASYYRKTDICVLVYDITNKKSFENIQFWVNQFFKFSQKEQENYNLFLVGNEMNIKGQRTVFSQDVQKYMQKRKNIIHLQINVKQKCDIDKLFQLIAQQCVENKSDQINIPVNMYEEVRKNPLRWCY